MGLGMLEGSLSVRSGQRGQFCHDRPRLNFSGQFVNQLRMRVLIDCGAKDLFSTANSQGTHLGTQGVFDAVQFLFDLGLSLSLHTVSFDASLFTGFLDKLSSA